MLHPIQQRVNKNSERCIRNSRTYLVHPTPSHVQANQAARNEEEDDLMHNIEEDGQQEAGAGIFYIDLDAERRGGEPYNGFRKPIESDRVLRKRVLQNADQASRKQPGERIAASGGEANHDKQRKIEDFEKRKSQRHPRLQKDRDKREQDRGRKAETVDLNLLARGVSDGHVIVECPGQ